MVQAGEEERRPALHSGVPGHQILDGGALGVAQMKRSGHVGRRLDDDEGLLGPVGARTLAVGVEDVGVEPSLEDGVLDVAGPVGFGQIGRFGPVGALARSVRLPRLRLVRHRSLRQ